MQGVMLAPTINLFLDVGQPGASVPVTSSILSFLDPSPAHTGPEMGCRVCQLLLTEHEMFYRQGLHAPATSEVGNAARGVILLLHEHLESGLA